MRISRRDFLIRSAETIVVLSTTGLVSTILSSCGNGPTGPSNVSSLKTIQGTVNNSKISINIGSSSPIANKNTRALVVYNGGSSAVIVEHNPDDTFKAISAICTHQGCVVSEFDGTDFVCPCHGSKFDLNGNVVQGPAPSNLRQYSTSVEGSSLIITL